MALKVAAAVAELLGLLLLLPVVAVAVVAQHLIKARALQQHLEVLQSLEVLIKARALQQHLEVLQNLEVLIKARALQRHLEAPQVL